MKKYAQVSYNIYGNFTNYGSALHTYALQRIINNLDCAEKIESIVLDYCPDVLCNVDVLNPVENLWDADEESKKMIELSMPAIRANADKFNLFYKNYIKFSTKKYTSENFNESLEQENLDGYICGSDTIWCIREFRGFDDGYYGNFPAMKKSRTISYAASFGDVEFTPQELEVLRERMQNFQAISIREDINYNFIRECVGNDVMVQRVLDPTLLLKGEDYVPITENRQIDIPYILLYVRRYNKEMEQYAEELAKKMSCKVVEISLRAINSKRNIMRYDAGVEEFLSLVKNAEYVITNSFHGAIFAIQFHVPFNVFLREQANTKIDKLLSLLELSHCKKYNSEKIDICNIDFEKTDRIIEKKRKDSIRFLKDALEMDS